MELQWEEGFCISVRVECGAVVLSANQAGLQSLAKHLSALAQGKTGDHIHLDSNNSLEENSVELIVEKIEG